MKKERCKTKGKSMLTNVLQMKESKSFSFALSKQASIKVKHLVLGATHLLLLSVHVSKEGTVEECRLTEKILG